MKKKPLFILLAIITTLLLVGCSQNNKQTNEDSAGELAPLDYSLMDLANTYPSLTELSGDSTLIAEVNINGKTEDISYEGANFVINMAEVVDVIKGDPSLKGSNINILEVKSFSINRTKTTDHFILFFQKYEGPVTDDAYVITGVYQGKYNINENNTISYDADKYNGEVTFQKTVNQLTVEEFKKEIYEAINQGNSSSK